MVSQQCAKGHKLVSEFFPMSVTDFFFTKLTSTVKCRSHFTNLISFSRYSEETVYISDTLVKYLVLLFRN